MIAKPTSTALALLFAAVPAFAAPLAEPVPVAELARTVNIPYDQFTLPNGLRVVVSTDRKAPVVAVSVWYNVGSKFEPKGKSGFAHLYEHLMFNGSENNPGEFFKPLKEEGATDYNGTTAFDRTNYFETVPTGALDRALFLESDRMGHLTGAITQSVLDEQRGVVENEKRQDDNQPYGLIFYNVIGGLFPADHPYGHTTIGSMADIDSASLADVKGWFRDHYGPNNAVLVLAGDIDVATAHRLVEKYFGAIPRGPRSIEPPAPIPTLPHPVTETMRDRVAQTLISRYWVVPGMRDHAEAPLDVAAGVLGGMASSRLADILVRREKLAVQVTADNASQAQLGLFSIEILVRPGVDPEAATRRLDAILADFLQHGPTADEVRRYVTTSISQRISGLDAVGGFGGKAVTLATGALLAGDPGHYRREIADLAAQTPESVRLAAAQWLSRPAYTLTVLPGERAAYAEAKGTAPAPSDDQPVKGNRGPMPDVGAVPGLAFPKVQRARLGNGIELIYAQRPGLPMTLLTMNFDAGYAADEPSRRGIGSLTLAMFEEGTTSLDSSQFAQAQERLGARLSHYITGDESVFSLSVPSANLSPTLALLGDEVLHPAFAADVLERVRNQQLAQIGQELTDPYSLAQRVLPPLVYGARSPYAQILGSGDPKAVAALSRDDLIAYQRAWIRPEKAKIFVVSDRPMAEIEAVLNAQFDGGRGDAHPGAKSFPAENVAPASRIILIDRPDSPQAMIVGGVPTPVKGVDFMLPLFVANDALGGNFMSRINLDLREARHWSYGASSEFQRQTQAAPYIVYAPVQTDKAGPALVSLRSDIDAYLGDQPMTAAEYDRAITGSIRQLSGEFSTGQAVLQGIEINDIYRRPDDYYVQLPALYRSLTRAGVTAALDKAIDPKHFIWVIVGDAAKVKPQLAPIGLPVDVIPPPANAAGQ